MTIRPARRARRTPATTSLRDAIVVLAILAVGTTVQVSVDGSGRGPVDAVAAETAAPPSTLTSPTPSARPFDPATSAVAPASTVASEASTLRFRARIPAANESIEIEAAFSDDVECRVREALEATGRDLAPTFHVLANRIAGNT